MSHSEASDPDRPVELVLPASVASPVILLCDHATNRLPAAYGTLGLAQDELSRHIAYDIGAAGVTRAIARRLGAVAVLSCWSRLLIDPNRGQDDPTLIMRLSDGAVVPGNRNLDVAERQRRIEAYYTPYHATIEGLIAGRLADGEVPVLLSIHSFTPVWRGLSRPWHAAVLWDRDPRLAMPLIAGLRADTSLCVGDNEPYSGKLVGDTLWRHGTRRGIAHAIVEIRQDLILDEVGQEAWAARLADLMASMLADPGAASRMLRIEHFGSTSDPPAGDL